MSRSRPGLAALIGVMALVLLVLGLVRVDSLPLIGADRREYRAEFSDAGGLKPGSPVQVAGVRAGEVTDIEIGEDSIDVIFEVDAAIELGNATVAAVSAADLLGSKFLEIRPDGSGTMSAGDRIPLERTIAAYDVVAAFEDLTATTKRIDTSQLAQALDTMADTFRDAPPQVKAALGGLSRFSRTLASRDRELSSLLEHAETSTGVLADRRENLSSLIDSTGLLLDELLLRRQVIHNFLVNTTELSRALRAVVHDNQASLDPALTHLEGVTSLLRDREKAIRITLRNLRAYGSYFVNVVGSGPWFDNFIPRLPTGIEVTQ